MAVGEIVCCPDPEYCLSAGPGSMTPRGTDPWSGRHEVHPGLPPDLFTLDAFRSLLVLARSPDLYRGSHTLITSKVWNVINISIYIPGHQWNLAWCCGLILVIQIQDRTRYRNKRERDFSGARRSAFPTWSPGCLYTLGLGNLNSLVSGNGGILCTGLRAPKFDGSRGLLMFKHLWLGSIISPLVSCIRRKMLLEVKI